MLRVGLVRTRHTDQGMMGVLILPDGVFCNTLELPWRDNRPKRSCIPLGEYDVKIRQSPRFGRIYEVQNVPDRSYILIHSGNLAGDVEKGYVSHVEGCILLGKYFGPLEGQLAVLASRPTVREFMETTGGQAFRLLVEDQS
jgi:Family of unknown function (DUF5675)